MYKNLVNKEDIYIFHWHTINKNFVAFYSLLNDSNDVYGLDLQMPDVFHHLNTYVGTEEIIDIISEHLDGLLELNEFKINSFEILTFEELLNHKDKEMTGTPFFKGRCLTYIRDKKIKTIINGN
jgi:hypothetical protein